MKIPGPASDRASLSIYVIHENDAWIEPLRSAFAEQGLPYQAWHLDQGVLDLTSPPPPGVFYNRMSASSHTRGHRYAPELTGAVLAWLKRYGRTVVNGERALQLELSKVAQYQALAEFGIVTPPTLAVVGQNILDAARQLGFPIILKHNRAGKGLGVRLLSSEQQLREHLSSSDFAESVDGITLVQRYIKAPEPFITRAEFIGDRLLYAVQVNTSQGFELCPADACQTDVTVAVGGVSRAESEVEMFRILPEFDHPLVPAWRAMLAANGIGIAGIEFILDEAGRAYTYDINTNTNYNPQAEAKDGRQGMAAIAEYLGALLRQEGSRGTTAA